MKSPTELVSLFRSKGLKVTPQRELVFRLLHGNTSHPTADSIYSDAVQVMPMMSLKTVYQVLNDLRALGELRTFDVGSGAVRFDPNTADHHHLVCTNCGDLHDLELDTASLALTKSQQRGFSLSEVDVTFRGLCGPCRRLI